MAKIENAVIKSTMFGIEDHGILTAFVFVEGEGWGCGFGGFALDSWDDSAGKRMPQAAGLGFLVGVMKAVGVEKWEALPGTNCRVETEGLGGGILRIGHIIKNQWFDAKKHFADK